MAFALTEEQSRAVHDRGGGLLVSAAAGSGKTRVLVERLLDRVTGEGADIDDFLVITYTRAAAAELRARIAQELSDRLAERPNDRHLRRQSTLVYRAQISTIHSFCSALLREEGHRLHGLRHPRIALDNARRDFVLTSREEDIIRKHMFPLTLRPPRYKESVVVTCADKLCAMGELVNLAALRRRVERVHTRLQDG